MNNYFDPRISRIIELETRITLALSKGHKSSDNDEFQKDRLELKELRKQLKDKSDYSNIRTGIS